MLHRWARIRAFTIIELLVVISIIGILVAMVVPALSGVRRQSRKTNELNAIRQVGMAWQLYGNNNGDAVLPGFLEAAVQMPPVAGVSRGWDVTYKFPSGTDIPIDMTEPIAGPWTWRLMANLHFNYDMVFGYTGGEGWDMATVDTNPDLARAIAYQPAFGYNGYYLGGYWTMLQDFSGTVDVPRPMFWNHCKSGTRQALDIPQSIGQIRNASNMIVFCSSSKLPPGVYQRFNEDTPGAHLVVPATLAEAVQWGRTSTGDIGSMQVFGSPTTFAPIARYTNTAAYYCADGSVDQTAVVNLIDQRKWINSATDPEYTHTTCPP